MVTGLNNAMQLFKDANMPYYKLYEGFEMKPTNCIAESSGDESMTDVTSNAAKVEQVLSMLSPGKYILSARKTFGSNQSGVNIRFEIPYAGAAGGAPSAAIGALPAHMQGWIHPAEHKAAIERMEFNKRMEDMERKMEEAAKKKEPKLSGLDKFLDQHGATVIPAFLGLLTQKLGLQGPQVALAGFNQTQVPENSLTPDQNQNQPAPPTADTNTLKLKYAVDEATRLEGGNVSEAVELILKVVIWRSQNEATYQAMLKPILQTVDTTNINLNQQPPTNEN